MVYNVNQTIQSFEDSVQEFEKGRLFEKKIDFTHEIAPFHQTISDIFQMIVLQYHTLLSGQAIGSAPLDYEEIGKQLHHFLGESSNRTYEEFHRKLTKKRDLFAESRKQTWKQRKEDYKDFIQTLQQTVKALQQGTCDVLKKELKKTLTHQSEAIETICQKIHRIDTSIAPLKGSKEELCTQLFQERQRWTEMIQSLGESKAVEGKAKQIATLANMFAIPGHPERGILQKEHLAFSNAMRNLTWDVSNLESFGNSLLSSFRERVKLLEEIHDKYSPQKRQEILQGQISLKELKKDFNHLIILIFYMRQMMDVPWDQHPLQAVQHGFQNRFPWIARVCDQMTTQGEDGEPDGLLVFMGKILEGKIDPEESQINLHLLRNEMPEIHLTWRARLWNFICAIFQAIASLFTSRSRAL